MKQMKSYRLDEAVIWKIQKTAEEKNISQTEVIENAINMYRLVLSVDDEKAWAITADWLKQQF